MKMIFAVGPNHEFGLSNGSLPWNHVKEDMQHFNKFTQGTIPVMGRKTWESLPDAKLPRRQCVIISQSGEVEDPRDSIVCGNVPLALAKATELAGGNTESVCIIGGSNLLLSTAGMVTQLSISCISEYAMKTPHWGLTTSYLPILDILHATGMKGLVDYNTILSTEKVIITLIK